MESMCNFPFPVLLLCPYVFFCLVILSSYCFLSIKTEIFTFITVRKYGKRFSLTNLSHLFLLLLIAWMWQEERQMRFCPCWITVRLWDVTWGTGMPCYISWHMPVKSIEQVRWNAGDDSDGFTSGCSKQGHIHCTTSIQKKAAGIFAILL